MNRNRISELQSKAYSAYLNGDKIQDILDWLEYKEHYSISRNALYKYWTRHGMDRIRG